MAGNYSQKKGQRVEREIAESLKELFPEAQRGLGQARSGGESADIEGTPFWIQVKANGRLKDALLQAERDTDGRPPLAIVHEDYDRESPFVALRLVSLLALIRAAGRTMAKCTRAEDDNRSMQVEATSAEIDRRNLERRVKEMRAEIDKLAVDAQEASHRATREAEKGAEWKAEAERAHRLAEARAAALRAAGEPIPAGGLPKGEGAEAFRQLAGYWRFEARRIEEENTRLSEDARAWRALLSASFARCTLEAGCVRPATCVGVGEDEAYFGCDEHCGHGNEDHWCKQFPESDKAALGKLACKWCGGLDGVCDYTAHPGGETARQG